MSKYLPLLLALLLTAGAAFGAGPADDFVELQPGVWQLEEGSKTVTVADGAVALPFIRAHFEHRATTLLARYLDNPSDELWQAVTLAVQHAEEVSAIEKAGGPVSTAPVTEATVQNVFAWAFWARATIASATADYEDPSVSADVYSETFTNPGTGFNSCSDSGLDVTCNSFSSGAGNPWTGCEANAYAEIWIPSTATLISQSDVATECL